MRLSISVGRAVRDSSVAFGRLNVGWFVCCLLLKLFCTFVCNH